MNTFKDKHPEIFSYVHVVCTRDNLPCEFYAWLSCLNDTKYLWNISTPETILSYPVEDEDQWELIVKS